MFREHIKRLQPPPNPFLLRSTCCRPPDRQSSQSMKFWGDALSKPSQRNVCTCYSILVRHEKFSHRLLYASKMLISCRNFKFYFATSLIFWVKDTQILTTNKMKSSPIRNITCLLDIKKYLIWQRLRNPFKAQISQLFLDLLDKLNSEEKISD